MKVPIKSAKTRNMSSLRSILLSLSLLLLVQFSIAAYADNFSGTISIKDNKIFLNVDTSNRLEIKPLNQASVQNLQRLNDGDLLVGTGQIINGELVLQTIDFVGLKQLLGLWSAPTTWLNFNDFSSVTVLLPGDLKKSGKFSTLQYSIAPASQNSWRIFFSDENSVILATLKLKSNSAELQFLNSENGESAQTIELEKETR